MDNLITIYHVRKAGLCSRGARAFAVKNNMDWSLFLREGISPDKLREINDAMAKQVLRVYDEELKAIKD